MKLEHYKLSKPYPFIKLIRDGQDIVFSFLSFYLRINLFGNTLRGGN